MYECATHTSSSLVSLHLLISANVDINRTCVVSFSCMPWVMLQYLQMSRIPEAAGKMAAEPDSVRQDVFRTSSPLVWRHLATAGTASVCMLTSEKQSNAAAEGERGVLKGSWDLFWLKGYKIHIKM